MEQKFQVDERREYLDHQDSVKSIKESGEGLNEDVIKLISEDKNEPEWMLQKRLQSYEIFKKLKMPGFGPSLKELNLDKIKYFVKPDANKNAKTWDDVPDEIKKTFEKLGIPEAERNALAGTGGQFDSDVVYHNLKKEWEDKGVIFVDMDVAVQEYPELVKEYFMTQNVSPSLHKFSALHGAVWSGGTFIYVPKNVKVEMPLQAYFRMNAIRGGQFEHTLIIADEGSEVSYVEGCSSPRFVEGNNALHAGCVELFVKEGARIRYSSVENWSKNTYNLNTKRAIVDKDGIVEWVNANNGSKATLLYPCSILRGENARSDFLGIAYAGESQNQDTGCKVYHLAKGTSSVIKSKSISKDGGVTTYRGLLSIKKGAVNSKSSVQCDALMLDSKSKSNTVPYMDVKESKVDVAHEATVGKISGDQLFYLQSRGIKEEDAIKLIVAGFFEPITKALPIEYAVEFNRLIELELEGSIG
ncbi:Fe-S cluster assembly protein SufB [archaeon]|nr:Fe-S cluster assembly protein SufB [archaeon]|tara:strand:- start:9758 stop:11170 length:1413 start_codon:yes stop_codon:yes gene_type:complete